MSIWHTVKSQEDVELSEDGTEIDVLFKSDGQGNHYISIPVDIIRGAITQLMTALKLIDSLIELNTTYYDLCNGDNVGDKFVEGQQSAFYIVLRDLRQIKKDIRS